MPHIEEKEEDLISSSTHPEYDDNIDNWEKFRLTFNSGSDFINEYLVKFTNREDITDFENRKAITHNPAFAKAALNDIKNAIFQRIVDVSRKDGSSSYTNAVAGKDTGVDRRGSTMNSFIGRKILEELLVIGKVGVFVDMPILNGPSLVDSENQQPYLYPYIAEDIRNWSLNTTQNLTEFNAILLRDLVFTLDPKTQLPSGTVIRYRYLWVTEDNGVGVRFYNEESKLIGETLLDIEKIPFIIFELSESLLIDVADYQISLLNLASSDMSYALKSNFPFYTEQFDPRTVSEFLRPSETTIFDDGTTRKTGEAADAQISRSEEIKIGITQGRRYPMQAERPGFIHPSSEPLEVSMQKQEQLKKDIKLLVNVAVSSLSTQRSSAESKEFDEHTLENGLSAIGLELQHGENLIAKYWGMFEGSKEIATVKYPEKYSLKSEEDRRRDAQTLKEIMPTVPSGIFQKEISKEIATLTIGSKVSVEQLERIKAEIEKSDYITSDIEEIAKDIEQGLVSLETASKARGYKDDEVQKARQDHAERLKRISQSQEPKDSRQGREEKAESRETTEDDVVTDKTRGEEK